MFLCAEKRFLNRKKIVWTRVTIKASFLSKRLASIRNPHLPFAFHRPIKVTDIRNVPAICGSTEERRESKHWYFFHPCCERFIGCYEAPSIPPPKTPPPIISLLYLLRVNHTFLSLLACVFAAAYGFWGHAAVARYHRQHQDGLGSATRLWVNWVTCGRLGFKIVFPCLCM